MIKKKQLREESFWESGLNAAMSTADCTKHRTATFIWADAQSVCVLSEQE